MTLRVQDQSPQVQAMAKNWPIVDALLGGTAAMRDAGKAFLPQWPAEEDDAYLMRSKTATLFPAFRRTLSVMAGKPFSRQMIISDDVPSSVDDLLDDVNMEGVSLHVFASEVMREALAYGLCGVLVEFTRRPEGVGDMLGQEKAAGLRPYLSFYRHDDILGWRHEKDRGRHRLTQLRLRESITLEDGEYGTKTMQRIRVLYPGRWELYEESAKDKYDLIDSGFTDNMSEIPFVPFYGCKLGFMRGESPLLDLAHLNVKHWQSQSDQDTILHVARVPILAVIGADDGTQLNVGASSAVSVPLGGDIKFVEHSGAAIGAGSAALIALEQQMIQTGAELLVKQPGQRTATEAAGDAEASKSELLAIVEDFEDSLDQCLQLMAAWLREKSGGNVSLYKDFGASSLSDASAQLILSMQGAGLLSKSTAIKEMQRRAILMPDIDPATEMEAAQQDAPSAIGALFCRCHFGLFVGPFLGRRLPIVAETGRKKPPLRAAILGDFLFLLQFEERGGAACRIRTGDLFITNELLYQLS